MSASSGNITIDTKSFNREVDKFAKRYGVSAKDVMHDQMRLWVKDLMKVTPPKTGGQGKKAILRDLRKIMVPMKDSKKLRFYEKTFGRYVPEYVFNYIGKSLKEWHRGKRDRTGRVRDVNNAKHKVGGYTFADKMYVKRSIFNKYLREKQKSVGKLKAGWLPAARLFGLRAPAWVMKQASIRGSAVDRMKKDGSGFLEAVNSVPWAQEVIGRWVDFTRRTRVRDLQKHLQKRLDRLGQQFSRAK